MTIKPFSLEEIPKQRLDTNLPSINDDPSDELGEVDEILNGDNEGIVRNRTSVASFAQNNRLVLTLELKFEGIKEGQKTNFIKEEVVVSCEIGPDCPFDYMCNVDDMKTGKAETGFCQVDSRLDLVFFDRVTNPINMSHSNI